MANRTEDVDRRSLLRFMGAATMLPELPLSGSGRIVHEVAAPAQDALVKPAHSIRFAVIGVDHNHILSMTAAVIHGVAQLGSFPGTTPKGIADSHLRYPDTKVARGEGG